jgi:hypothetical protein
MPATSRLNNGATLDAPVRAYITTGAYATRIFSYATSFNSSTYETTGTLTALGTAISGTTKNVAGIVLRETGKKLYVGINPGVFTYMVGVYYNSPDTALTFNGFIDPNDSVFAPFNTDKPYFLEEAADPVDGTPADQGAPVFTAGTVTAAGQIRSSTVTPLATSGTITFDGSLGQVYTITPTGNVELDATTVPAAGSIVYLIVTTSGTTSYNIVFDANFKDQGTLATGATSGAVFTVTFVSNGTNLNEVSRTVAM